MAQKRHPELSSKSQLLALKEIPETSNVNFVPLIANRYIENGSLECWSNKSRETILSQLDNEDTVSPLAEHSNIFHHLYQKRNSDDFVDDRRFRH